jgi:hypothetical protein
MYFFKENKKLFFTVLINLFRSTGTELWLRLYILKISCVVNSLICRWCDQHSINKMLTSKAYFYIHLSIVPPVIHICNYARQCPPPPGSTNKRSVTRPIRDGQPAEKPNVLNATQICLTSQQQEPLIWNYIVCPCNILRDIKVTSL